MNKLILTCDLDNTLIYSYKKKQPNDICIEKINNKEQGFISRKVINFLKEYKERIELIPVTTRSIEQYLRIEWPENCIPEYAITTNGAVLLKNGQIDKDWYLTSLEMTKICNRELEILYETFSDDVRFIRCKYIDNIYVFVYCAENIIPSEIERTYKRYKNINVNASGKKVYFCPMGIDKGNAIVRLKEKFNFKTIVSAGDSVIDIPMLEKTDVSFVPNEFLNQSIIKKATVCDGGRFSDLFIDGVKELIQNNGF